MTKFDKNANSGVLQQYLWSIVSQYVLIIEYYISKYPRLHVRVGKHGHLLSFWLLFKLGHTTMHT